MKNNVQKKAKRVQVAELSQFILLTIILFGFWVIMSGIWQLKFLVVGLATSLVVAWVTLPLLRLSSVSDQNKSYMAFSLPYLKLMAYIPWLLWEILKANVEVVKLILDPRMPIQPVMVTFEKPMSNPIAHVFLANSITLTPGTVTVDLRDGVYHVHAINQKAAESLAPADGEGDMPRRISILFNENQTKDERGATS